ncbi:MAG: T9SS type A sorting domain-containing protein, partial [Ignavibacteria bacterium]|nr:T9SS type A sorting domain-containing protein [Ignavibacteria bacterium]
EIPSGYNLYYNYPNPFNPSTNIKFEIPQNTIVNLSVYDAAGRRVAELINEEMQPGVYTANWDAGDMQSGIYFAKITVGGFARTVKMMLIK